MVDMQAHLILALKYFRQAFFGQHYGTMSIPTLPDVTGVNALGMSRDVMKFP